MPEVLPVVLVEAFVHLLKGNAKAMKKAFKMVFNIWDPPLLVGVRINANEFVWELSTPCISHQPPFLSNEFVVVFTNSPLSLSMLTVFNRLFSPICIGGRSRQVLRRTSWSSTYPLALVSRSGRAHDNGWNASSKRRTRSGWGLGCNSLRLFIMCRAYYSWRPKPLDTVEVASKATHCVAC